MIRFEIEALQLGADKEWHVKGSSPWGQKTWEQPEAKQAEGGSTMWSMVVAGPIAETLGSSTGLHSWESGCRERPTVLAPSGLGLREMAHSDGTAWLKDRSPAWCRAYGHDGYHVLTSCWTGAGSPQGGSLWISAAPAGRCLEMPSSGWPTPGGWVSLPEEG